MAFDPDSSGRDAARRLVTGLSDQGPPEQAPGMTVSRFRSPGTDTGGLGAALVRWYEEQGLESDLAEVGDSVVVRCRSKGGRGLVGAARGLTVVLRQDGVDLAVEVGAARWSDKAWVAGAGVLLMGSLAVIPLAASAIGAWRQWRLPAQTLDFLRATAPSFRGQRRAQGDRSPLLAPAPSTPPAPPPRPAARREQPPRPTRQMVEVNSATVGQLASVPGLDQSAARALVAERERLAGYSSWDQVRAVLTRQIAPHQLAQVRPCLSMVPARRTAAPGRGPLDL